MKKNNKKIFITFKKFNDSFIGAVPLHEIEEGRIFDEKQLKVASDIYGRSIHAMKEILLKMEDMKLKKIALPALTAWKLGDEIISLNKKLKKKDFVIDGLYAHLTRDLKRKKTWIKTMIIFRNNLENVNLIPRNLKWVLCKTAPKKAALLILKGKQPK